MSFHNVKNSDKQKEKAKWQVPMRTWRGKTKEYYLTEDLEEKFREMFPIHPNRRLMRWFGISSFTVQRFRRELGLVKNKTAIYKDLGRNERRTQVWRETMEKDMLRVKYGLEQKTKFRIVLSPMKHGASSQKYSMITRNNYFSDPEHSDWICYDNDTRRSARCEATAVKRGLKVVEGQN